MLNLNKDVNIVTATVDDISIQANPLKLSRKQIEVSVEKEALIKHLINLYTDKLVQEIYGKEYIEEHGRIGNYLKANNISIIKVPIDNPILAQHPEHFENITGHNVLSPLAVSMEQLKNYLFTNIKGI